MAQQFEQCILLPPQQTALLDDGFAVVRRAQLLHERRQRDLQVPPLRAVFGDQPADQRNSCQQKQHQQHNDRPLQRAGNRAQNIMNAEGFLRSS